MRNSWLCGNRYDHAIGSSVFRLILALVEGWHLEKENDDHNSKFIMNHPLLHKVEGLKRRVETLPEVHRVDHVVRVNGLASVQPDGRYLYKSRTFPTGELIHQHDVGILRVLGVGEYSNLCELVSNPIGKALVIFQHKGCLPFEREEPQYWIRCTVWEQISLDEAMQEGYILWDQTIVDGHLWIARRTRLATPSSCGTEFVVFVYPYRVS